MIRFAHLCRFSLPPSARDPHKVACVEAYLRAVGMFRDYSNPAQDPVFSQTVELDLSTVVPSTQRTQAASGSCRCSRHERDFQQCLTNKVSGTHCS